jgi:hypothetical protein
MPSRKAIAAALLARLTSGGQFTLSGRRNAAPEQAASPDKPGLFLIKPRESYKYDNEQQHGVPPVRDMEFLAAVYTDVGANPSAVPADIIDDLLDAIDTALAPNFADQVNNGARQTLGGLVYDCRIEGEVELAPGDSQGKGQVAIPIRVVLNQYP